jgi:hypothetical protein
MVMGSAIGGTKEREHDECKGPLVIGFGAKEEFGFAFEIITNKKRRILCRLN